MQATKGPRIKGSALRECARYVQREFATEVGERIVTSLPADMLAAIDPRADAFGFVASSWYPAEYAHRLLDAMASGKPPAAQRMLVHELAFGAVATALRGVYRFVFERIATPERYARAIQPMWRMLHDNGDREITVVGAGEATSRTWNWPGHHPLVCLFTCETMAAVFSAMGCRHVTVSRTACVSDADAECRATICWEG